MSDMSTDAAILGIPDGWEIEKITFINPHGEPEVTLQKIGSMFNPNKYAIEHHTSLPCAIRLASLKAKELQNADK